MLFEISPLTQEYEQIHTLLMFKLAKYWNNTPSVHYCLVLISQIEGLQLHVSKNPAEIPLGPLAGFLAEMTTIHDWNHWSSSSPPTYSALFSFRVKTKENLITSQLDGKITRTPRWARTSRREEKKLISFLSLSSMRSSFLLYFNEDPRTC